MRNNKICISKSVMFIVSVAVILLGVVMVTNYVNNQPISTKSRAATVAFPTLPPVGNSTTSRESSKYRTKPRQPNPTQVLPIPTVNLFPTSSQANRTITISKDENEITEGYMGLRSVFYILNNNSPSYKVILSVLSAGSTDASSACDPNSITLMINDEIPIVSPEDKVRIVTEKIYEDNRQFVGYYVVDDDNNTRYFINKTIGPTQYVYIWPYEYDKNTGETIQPVPNRRKEYCLLTP